MDTFRDNPNFLADFAYDWAPRPGLPRWWQPGLVAGLMYAGERLRKRARQNLPGNTSQPVRKMPRLTRYQRDIMRRPMLVRYGMRRSRRRLRRRGTYSRRRRMRPMRRRRSATYKNTDDILYTGGFTFGRVITLANARLSPGQRNMSMHLMNYIWFTDLLGNHGKYDLTNIVSTQTTGTELSLAENYRVYANRSRNNVMPFWVRRQSLTLHITPDWQAQGVPNRTDATPVFSDDAHMVVIIYKFHAKKKLLPAEYTNPVNSNKRLWYNSAGGNATDTLAIPQYNSGTGNGFFTEWAEGIRKRVNTSGAFGGSTQSAQPPTVNNPTWTTGTSDSLINWGVINAEGVTPYMSPNILSKYRVSHKAHKIYPGHAKTVTLRFPDIYFNNADLGLELPTPDLNTTNAKYFPRNMPGFAVACYMASNRDDLSIVPTLPMSVRYKYRAKFVVPGSKCGGNLIMQNIESNTQATTGYTNPFPVNPSNPQRTVTAAFPAGAADGFP